MKDFIARVSGKGWAIPKARLLIDADGHAAVFTPGVTEPVRTFTLDAVGGGKLARTGIDDGDGRPVRWVSVPAGCGCWSMSKGKVSTQALVARWEKAKATA